MVSEVQVNIESMAFKGYGVARVNGKVTFIPYTVKGDMALVDLTEEKKDYSIARVSKIIKPSPWRVEPQCPYFGRCGGCQWQHIDHLIQGELKKEILQETLKRLGRLEKFPPKKIPTITVIPSPQPYRYRVRVQLKAQGEGIGYYRTKSHRIVDIDHCPIAHPLVNQVIFLLRNALPFVTRAEEIKINVSPEKGEGILILRSLSIHPEMEDFAKDLLKNHSILKGVVLERAGGSKLFGNPCLNFTVSSHRHGETKSLRFRASPESFFQVNPGQNQRLIETVIKFGDLKGGERILDLYAGVGNFTLPLAMGAKEVLGIEESRMAVKDARFNAETNSIKNCQFVGGRVEDVLKGLETRNFDLVVLDPPRTGCKRVLDHIIRLEPKKIVYVSCEPTTLSRDLSLFSERGYRLQELTLIDLFPQSYHMEVAALLRSPC